MGVPGLGGNSMSKALFAILLSLSLGVIKAQPQTPPSTPPQAQPAQPPMDQAVDPSRMAEAKGTPGAKAAEVDNNYIIGAEDVLAVKVWEDTRFNESYTVLPNGKITLALYGPIQAANLTPPQLEASIDKALESCCLNKAHATVQVQGVHSKKIYFDGDGIGSGSLDLVVPLRLLEAISTKGGFKEFADKRHIRVLRDGKPFGKPINYSDLMKGKHPEMNIVLLPGDHIIVN